MKTATLLSFCLVGCQVTQLIAVVDSDYASPDPLAAIQILVTDMDAEEVGGEYISLSSNSLPISFGVQPKGGLKDENVTIRFQALTRDDGLLVERTVVVGFEPKEHRLLSVFLHQSCAGVTCPADRTCIEQGCRPSFVDVASLPRIDPGDEFTDPGVPDGGVRPPSPCDNCVPSAACIEMDTGLPCTTDACFCTGRCDPFNPVPVCPIGEACFWNDQSVRGAGVCVSEQASTLSNHPAPCTTGDQCDFFENWGCWGPTSGVENLGTCTSFCSPPDDLGFCENRISMSTCVDLGGVAACLIRLPPIGDLGMDCTTGGQCETGYCSLANFCSVDCSGPTICAEGSDCAYSADGQFCAQRCTLDSECNNPLHVCRMDQGNICYPSCAMIGCPPDTSCQPDGSCS